MAWLNYVTSRVVTKQTKWHVRPAKTRVSLGIADHAQADLSLRWAHDSFFFFFFFGWGGGGGCHDAALRSQSNNISINRLSATAEGYRNISI